MEHTYDTAFFDWVRITALRSAERVLAVVHDAVRPSSVVDVGCGEGAWLSVWASLGVASVAGLDGDYVDRDRLMIARDDFVAADLGTAFAVSRRFDLAQSLEVAEHLPPAASEAFVASLCRLSDIVLFSAAQPGQGGENHVNERPVSAWAGLFEGHGFAAFDCIRPALQKAEDVSPWYRFNIVLYANAAGRARLSDLALAARVADLKRLDGGGDFGWVLRKTLLRPLPVPVVSWLSRVNYRLACARQARARRLAA